MVLEIFEAIESPLTYVSNENFYLGEAHGTGASFIGPRQ